MAKNQNLQNPLYKLPTKPPNLSGVMWGAVLLGLVLIVVVSSIATQYLAWRLAFQPALGAPVAHLGSFPIYQPFGWVEWGWKYGTVEDAYLKSTTDPTFDAELLPLLRDYVGRPSALSDKQKQNVRADLASGISVAAIARKFTTSRQTIMRIRDERSQSVKKSPSQEGSGLNS